MLTQTDAYQQLIEFLSDNLSLFEISKTTSGSPTINDYFSDKLAENVMLVCQQHTQLSANDRFLVIREIDAINSDLEEVLQGVWHRSPSAEQQEFIDEFVGLIKNIVDSYLQTLPAPEA